VAATVMKPLLSPHSASPVSVTCTEGPSTEQSIGGLRSSVAQPALNIRPTITNPFFRKFTIPFKYSCFKFINLMRRPQDSTRYQNLCRANRGSPSCRPGGNAHHYLYCLYSYNLFFNIISSSLTIHRKAATTHSVQ